MNIAFPALIVLLLLLPGVLLSYSYRRGFFRRTPVTLGPLRDEIGRGIVWALVLHPVAFLLLGCFGWTPVPEALLRLTTETGTPDLQVAASQLYSWFEYLIGLNLGALALGTAAHAVVRRNHLDLRYDWLRFNNEWHYIFSGEARVFQAPQSERRVASIKRFLRANNLDFVFVSVVVSHGDDTILYWGVLSDYFFATDGSLDKIVLEDAQRRPLDPATDNQAAEAATPIEDERFYPIRGSFLVIRYANVRTLNVEYMVLADEE